MSNRTSHSYYVVMEDHGKRGLEAIVHPEDTRRTIVEMLKSGESKHVVFIHHVDGLFIEDVTSEIFDEAEAELRHPTFDRPNAADRQAFAFDHARALRNEVA